VNGPRFVTSTEGRGAVEELVEAGSCAALTCRRCLGVLLLLLLLLLVLKLLQFRNCCWRCIHRECDTKQDFCIVLSFCGQGSLPRWRSSPRQGETERSQGDGRCLCFVLVIAGNMQKPSRLRSPFVGSYVMSSCWVWVWVKGSPPCYGHHAAVISDRAAGKDCTGLEQASLIIQQGLMTSE